MTTSELVDDTWISALFFCPLDDSDGMLLGASRSHGAVVSSALGPYWPSPEGERLPNLGSILVIDAVPTAVDIGIYVIVYGLRPVNVRLRLSTDCAEVAPNTVYGYETQIAVGSPLHSEGAGPGAKRVRLHQCPLRFPGSYCLTASAGDASSIKIPLYVHLREVWERLERDRMKCEPRL